MRFFGAWRRLAARWRLSVWGGMAILVAGAVWARTFWLLPVYVFQESMLPTLQPGDLMVVDLRAYRSAPPRFGDIALFPDPESDELHFLVKRVVGLPGDRLAIVPQGVLRNRRALTEWYLSEAWLRPPYFQIDVPQGSVFVMGDNRNSSEDSRDYGPLPMEALIGRVAAIIWPRDRMRIIPREQARARHKGGDEALQERVPPRPGGAAG